ncbi:filamentous hemagglutinin N-terminal domain-containing protein [Fuerstiella marisgermanici]|uniref:two-partner secretion domain-containing protein n=1 Tax=Fuerstiella marisgermanici TaxID=1891926 RepID=UPI00097BBDE9|nr:filamentous hemagglutinin N-terminal domain-containing protein [Fuerstiella marisgermanici]
MIPRNTNWHAEFIHNLELKSRAHAVARRNEYRRQRSWSRNLRKRLATLLAAGAITVGGSLDWNASARAELPTGADVVAGAAIINSGGPVMDVNATSTRTIINWNQFSIGSGNTANFNLPDSSSAILNRVTTPDMPSVINGALNSNGNVMLVNPSGIMVGASGLVNTNAFTASTFDIANDKFMAGGALTFSGDSAAGLVNNGTINTGTGGAHLIANDISNNGSITSSGGNITLSGGGEVTLNNGVTYVQPTLETLSSGISPTAGLIQNTGTIRATGAATSGGEVYLVNPNGKILHDGTIAAHREPTRLAAAPGETSAASGGGSQGAHVQLEADEITLSENSSIDVAGTDGGGTVLVGGDWQGSGNMTQATSVTMEAGAMIDASATKGGDGGTIVLWSDVANAESITKAFGTLVARAGEVFGDGGQIETSGARIETDGVSVDAGAANGNGGHWLIDPYNYLIDAVAASNVVSALNTGTSVTVTTTADNASYGSSGTNTELGDIVVRSDIVTGAMSGDATLTLQAHRHINVDANIDATQNGNTAKLNVTLLADSDHSGDGINIVNGDSIKTNGGSLTFGDGSTATIGGSSVQVGGDVYISGTAAQSFETGGGTIAVNGETILANTNGVTFDSGDGAIVFGGVLNSGNQYTGVTSTQTWVGAVAHAKSGTGDQLGDTYLATITSRLENAIAGIAVDYAPSWLGGRRVTGIGTDSLWRWVTGPEGLQDSGNGLVFATGSHGATPVDGAFTNWNSGEPNNSGGNETVVQFVGAAGNWNDLPLNSSTLTQYVRETNLAPTAVTINAGSGSVTFNGGIGGSKALASLDVTASQGIAINGGQVNTTGTQTFHSPVLLGNHTHLSTIQSDIVFDSTVDSNSTSTPWNLTTTITPGNVYHWVDWTTWDAASKTATGTITVGSDVITVTYHNPQGIYGIQTSGGTAYWTGRGGGAFAGESPYVSDNVANGPSTTDLIQLRYAGSQTLTFSESVENLAFSIMSMNGNGYGFDQDFTIESYSGLNGAGPGYFGGGTMTKAIVGDTFQLNDGGINSASDGHSEPHGTIRFGNAFSELTWNSLSDETWNAFSVGVSGTSSTAGSVQFNGAVGSNAALGDITVNAAVQTTANIAAASSFDVTGLANLGGDITTSGDQTFGSAVTLGADTALTTTSNGNVNFVSTVDGDHDLSVETSGTGDVTLNAAIGANEALSGLTITTDGVGADVTVKSSIVVEGDVSIGGGDVLIGGDVTKSTAANTTVSLLASGSLTVDSGVTIGTATDTTDLAVASGTSGNFDGLLIGNGSLTKSGNGFLRINTVQTYTGDTTIHDGILMLGADDVLPDLTRLIVNANGILSLNSFDDTVGSIEGSGLIENGSIVRDGIVLWLDAGNGASYDGTGTTWNDLSGNGYDGTLFGDPTYNGSKRQFEFTTNAQYAQLGALPADFLSSGDGVLDGLTLFTVADFGTANLWERIVDFGSGDPTDNIILSRFGNTNAVNFELYPGSGGEEHKVDLTGTNTLITAGGGTRSYAGTADGTNFRLFADGNLEITTAETALPNEVELSNNYIGKSNWSADDTLRGSIGIVLVYDRALSSSEVQQNHSALIARSPATLTVGGNNLDTTFSGQLENGADTLNLTKIGTGALTLSGNNGYSGTTTINAGSLIVGAGGTSGTLGTGNVINNTDLLFNRSDDFTIVNDISGTGDLTKQGTNELTLTGDATYSGETDVSDGSLVFQNDVAPAISGFTGSGSVTIEPTGTKFSGAVTSNYGIADTITGLTIGKDGNTSDVTVNSVTNINGDVSLHGGNVAINNTLTTTAGNKLTIDASGDVTQTSAITTDSLALQGTGNFTIGNAGNSIGTLAGGESGTLLGNVAVTNPGALTVGTVGAQSGIVASGTINIATQSGDLTIAQDISTTDTSASAITLNAGQITAAGTATGGNLVLSNSPSITVGTGGRATLYTGSVADSMGLAELLNSGSGRFRYNSDESATNFSLALGSGVYGVYRERPTVSGAVGNQTVTYGTAPTLTPTITGTVNGDTTAQVFGAAPTIDVGGSTSTSGNYTVGDHSLTISAGAEQLGYAVNTFTGGTLTVNAKSITTSIAINGKVYDGTNAATITAGANGTILGDAVTVNGSAAFDNADAGTGKTVTVTGINLTGADASNYVLNSTSHSGTADITQK